VAPGKGPEFNPQHQKKKKKGSTTSKGKFRMQHEYSRLLDEKEKQVTNIQHEVKCFCSTTVFTSGLN
jgi:hypothetical protein